MSENRIIQGDLSEEDSSQLVEVEMNELCILVTQEDKYGTDISRMSNFFDVYIEQLSYELSTNIVSNELQKITIADMEILNDVISHAEVVMKGEYSYIPDFDNLPKDIKSKFQKGVYRIGESKQVDGNMRAVILNENGVRVKDITLKRVKNNPGTVETTRSIANQAQMKQIYAKLDYIQELQSYQIDRDRDRDILIPFLNARDCILRAQLAENLNDRKMNLLKATDELTKATNAVYTDIRTSAKHLSRLTRFPIFQKTKQIRNYIEYIAQDLQLATKYVGVQMNVFNYLEDRNNSNLALEGYQHMMHDFLSNDINLRNQSVAALVHQHFPYTESNRNFWVQLAEEMEPVLQLSTKSVNDKDLILVSIDEIGDNDEN